MSTCLGLYIEDNIIKYAKVSKEREQIKVESYGVKFYDNLEQAIKQIVEETYSYKIPISINLSNENYNYFYLFSMLNKKDMQNVINTEFESICYDNGLNKDAFETRYVLVNNIEDKEKVKAIHISANKADLAKKTQYLDSYRVTTASPIGIAITNIIEHQDNENYLVVNIEDRTTVTTVVDKKITDVKVIDDGTSQILSKINAKENSYLKAYEICKNTTIYTSEGKDLQYEENDYLDDIMPTLYNIVGEVRKISNESLNKIEKVYITGTASVINNIDIYFQEYLQDIKCEILKPYFINNTKAKINIKDYIEVNSPIALALQGLGEGLNGVNFKKETLKDKISEIMKIEIGGSKPKSGAISKLGSKLNMDLSFDFKERLTAFERTLLRTSLGLLMLIIVYTGISIFLNNSMNKKEEEILNATLQVNSQIKQISEDDTNIKAKTAKYVSMTQRLTDLNAKTQDKNKRKNAIPTLLNQIMFSIPKGVQITSIQNTSGTKIVINAQANTYDQLGYLKASIKNYGILTNVISDSGEKQTQDGLIKTTIEGDLPIE